MKWDCPNNRLQKKHIKECCVVKLLVPLPLLRKRAYTCGGDVAYVYILTVLVHNTSIKQKTEVYNPARIDKPVVGLKSLQY